MNMAETMNKNNALHLHTWLLITLCVLNFLDFRTTQIALALGAEEANPIVDFFIQYYGTTWAIFWFKAAMLSVLFIPLITRPVEWYSNYVKIALISVNLFYLGVVISNTINIIYML